MYFCKSNPSFLYKSPFSFSFSLLFSSSSTEKKVKNDLTAYDVLLHKHQFSPETASQVASVLTRIKNPEKSDSIVSFLKESGFSKSQLERVVKTMPALLAASLEKTIKPKFKIFQDMGFSAEDIAEIISYDPENLHRSADSRLRPSLSVLKRLLGSSAEVTKVLKISRWYLSRDLEKSVVPNIEYLKSCGVGMEQIIKNMYKYPRFLMYSPKHMKSSVKMVDEMGTCRSSRLFIRAVQVVEVLLATGKYDLSCIVNSPVSFTCSVEKKIIPRMQVLGILEITVMSSLRDKARSMAVVNLNVDKFHVGISSDSLYAWLPDYCSI
ncbi:unnamed protein product [Fraxinus pennsylvanica]|uniref:Uncharacterized protein n=1 Tax=Fraxinus pennsylvanica TaxID=56036 RepID=A0AAD2E0F1_9LAMI|nr:unnamed protein product [Fraxinus pennsylvanica]